MKGDFMNLDNYCICDDDNLKLALEKIDKNNHGFLIVLNNNRKVIGTLTDGDIRRFLINGIKLCDEVGQASNLNFKYIYDKSSLNDIVKIFKSSKINFLPILDKNDELVNIITKKQLHVFLLQDLQFDLMYDFFSLDENILEHEIYDRPWGIYKTTFLNKYSRAKIIKVYPNGELSLQEHKKREEHWIIVKGRGKLVIGESIKCVYEGDYIFIPKGCKHKIINESDSETLTISEIQLGEYFGEDDIIRYEDKYGRV